MEITRIIIPFSTKNPEEEGYYLCYENEKDLPIIVQVSKDEEGKTFWAHVGNGSFPITGDDFSLWSPKLDFFIIEED